MRQETTNGHQWTRIQKEQLCRGRDSASPFSDHYIFQLCRRLFVRVFSRPFVVQLPNSGLGSFIALGKTKCDVVECSPANRQAFKRAVEASHGLEPVGLRFEL